MRSPVSVVLLAAVLAAGCGPARTPGADALQEAFREGELTAQEAHGKRVFAQRCATCHGAEGRGDGQNAYNLKPPPPDFRESLAGLSVEDRRTVIEGGTAALGRSALCPPWGRTLDADEVEALVAYLAVTARAPADDEDDETPGRRRWRR